MNEFKKGIVLLCVAALFGVWVGYGLATRVGQNRAIQNECAHYDMRTGEFKWGLPQ